jgi:hypothetical protein
MTAVANDDREATVVCVSGTTIDGLRHLSTDEFRVFGLPSLAYLREGTTSSGSPTYNIHAADGSALIAVDDLDNALALAAYNKIVLVVTQ